MNNNVEEIKSRLNIVDVVGEYVRLTKGGSNWKGLCPFHHEKSPSFMVNEEKQIFHCFGCAKGGDVFTFVQEIESLEFREVLKMLAEKAGVQLEDFKADSFGNKKRILAALELATKFYEKQLWEGVGKEKALPYLKERGLSEESIKEFRLGFAPSGWRNILNFLKEKGFTIEEILQTGLLVEKSQDSIQNTKYKIQDTEHAYDRFRDRIMFPIADILGAVVGYSARVAPGGDESQAKYINTPETSVYHKSKALYGIFNAKMDIKRQNYVLLVEGNMDVIACHQAGLRNTVAVSGTALTGDQITTLKRYTENISMLFDMDSAGQKAAERSADLCLEKDLNIKVVTLSDGKDAADVAAKDPELLRNAVRKSVPVMEYFFSQTLAKHDKNTADGKHNIAKDVLAHVAHVGSQIEKSHWIKRVAHELDVEEKVVTDVLKSVKAPVTPFGNERKEPIIEENNSSFRKRSDIVRDSLVGLILSSPKIWQETLAGESENEWLKSDPLLSFVFKRGPEVSFSVDVFLAEIEDQRTKQNLNKLYFDAKYQFDQENVFEYDEADLKELVAGYIGQYVKELQKERLHSIIREMKNAEQAGNKGELAKLMGEFTKLSQEIK